MQRDFKGVWIPKEIWLNPKLSLIEKCFMVEIDSLDNEDGCFASNKYFAEFFGISKSRCTEIIKKLERNKFLTVDLERENKLIIKRILRVVNKLTTVDLELEQGYSENRTGVFGKPNRGIRKTEQGYSENRMIIIHYITIQ